MASPDDIKASKVESGSAPGISPVLHRMVVDVVLRQHNLCLLAVLHQNIQCVGTTPSLDLGVVELVPLITFHM